MHVAVSDTTTLMHRQGAGTVLTVLITSVIVINTYVYFIWCNSYAPFCSTVQLLKVRILAILFLSVCDLKPKLSQVNCREGTVA